MAVSTHSPQLLVEGLRAIFMQAQLGSDTDFISRLANIVTTGKRTEEFAFVGHVPSMDLWRDSRTISVLSAAIYRLTVLDYQASVSIDYRDLQDEQIALWGTRIAQMSQQAARHPIELLVGVMVNGGTLPGYDGVSLYNDAHPVRANESGTQDNALAATGTGSLADLQADYDAGHVAFNRFEDEGGKRYHGDLGPDFTVMTPPELFRNWSTVLFSSTVTTGGENVYRNNGDLITTGELTNTGDFYMHKLNGPVKPFMWLERQALQVQDTARPDEEWRATTDVVFGVDGRYVAGVGMWQYTISFT